MTGFQTRATQALSVVLLVLGVVLIARTIQSGVGGRLGLLIGGMLVLAGGARLYLSQR